MNRQIFAATLLTASLLPAYSYAAVDLGIALEYYTWTEDTQNDPPPHEYGPRTALHLNWTQDGDHGLLFGYRGKVYAAQVSYDTYYLSNNLPVATDTTYAGTAHEGQFLYRSEAGKYQLDYIGGMGWDYWRRTIASNQIEDYSILYLRGGVNLDQPEHRAGFHGGGGLKLPFWTLENAHLTDQGFTTNPILRPGRNISLYAEFGYRINPKIDITGYYDSWHFKQSGLITTSDGTKLWNVWQPRSTMEAFGLKAMYSF